MMSYKYESYKSGLEFLNAIKQDECWQNPLSILKESLGGDATDLYNEAREQIKNDFFLWKIHNYNIEKVIQIIWESKDKTIARLIALVVGMLSIEWLEQQEREGNLTINKGKKPVKKRSPKTLQKPRETMTFKRGKNVLEGHLSLLYFKLTHEKWIEGHEANFKALFSGKKDEDCELTWLSSFGKGTLVWLFKTLVNEGLIEVPKGYTLPAILEGHFKDKEGQWLKGLDKGDKPNDKAKTTMVECVKLLKTKPNNGHEDQSEDFQLKHDPYDRQDIKLHKK